MFSIDARQLPSLHTYERVKRWWEDTKPPRGAGWCSDTERPLKDNRSSHFALRKVGNSCYELRLYHTAIVTWHNENQVTLDATHDSVSTRAFADRYLPCGRVFTERGFTVFHHNGIKYNAGRDRVHLHVQDGAWMLSYPTPKITRRVLDPDKRREAQKVLKPFAAWARAIWAVSGNNGHHPWVGTESLWHPTRRISLEGVTPDNYERLVRRFSRFNFVPHKPAICVATDAEDILKGVTKRLYQDINAYIDIPYDAPLPKRSK